MGINEDTTTRQTGALRGSIENQGTLPLNKLKQKLVELCFEISKSKADQERLQNENHEQAVVISAIEQALASEKEKSTDIQNRLDAAQDRELDHTRKIKMWEDIGAANGNSEVERLRHLLESQKQQFLALKTTVHGLDSERELWLREKQVLQERLQSKTFLLDESEKRTLVLREALENSKTYSEEFDKVVVDLREKISLLVLNELSSKKEKIELQNTIYSLQDTLSRKQDEIAKLASTLDSMSSASQLEDIQNGHLKNEIGQLSLRISDLQNDKQTLLEQLVLVSKLSQSVQEFNLKNEQNVTPSLSSQTTPKETICDGSPKRVQFTEVGKNSQTVIKPANSPYKDAPAKSSRPTSMHDENTDSVSKYRALSISSSNLSKPASNNIPERYPLMTSPFRQKPFIESKQSFAENGIIPPVLARARSLLQAIRSPSKTPQQSSPVSRQEKSTTLNVLDTAPSPGKSFVGLNNESLVAQAQNMDNKVGSDSESLLLVTLRDDQNATPMSTQTSLVSSRSRLYLILSPSSPQGDISAESNAKQEENNNDTSMGLKTQISCDVHQVTTGQVEIEQAETSIEDTRSLEIERCNMPLEIPHISVAQEDDVNFSSVSPQP